jgi:hypothetical protein
VDNDRRGTDSGRDPGRRPTKAERKDQARIEREEIQRRMASRRRSRTIALVAGIAVVAVVILVVALTAGGTDEPTDTASATELPGMLATDAPWPANTEQLPERLDIIDLPAEGVAQHLHVPLYVYVDGDPVTVPANMGISQTAVSPLHTHDELGTIHVESAAVQDFTLGQVFDVWGVRLTAECLGGYCTDGEAVLRVYTGGEETSGDPRDVVLEDMSAIVVTFGSENQVPDPVPTGFPSAPAAT